MFRFTIALSELEQASTLRFGGVEIRKKLIRVRRLEIIARVFLFCLQEHIFVAHARRALAAVEVQLHDAVDTLQVAGQAFESVSEFSGHRRALHSGDLLEIGELRDLHPVAPALPAQSPGAKGRALPIVLDETDVVQAGV